MAAAPMRRGLFSLSLALLLDAAAAGSAHGEAAVLGLDQTGAEALADRQRLTSLKDVEMDLESTEQEEDKHFKQLESQIVGLVRQRDVVKRGEEKRNLDVSFVEAEVQRLQRKLKLRSAGGASETATAVETAAVAEAAEAAVTATASTGASTQAASHESQEMAEAQAAAEAAEAQAEAQAKAQAKAEAKAAAEAQEQARALAATQAAEQTRARAQAEAQARAQAEAQAQQGGQARQRQDQASTSADSSADSADDSFKQYMKEEDGEDEQNDADYEDSANALAGAIGWNRKEIESKADSAVKQLTEAIGGKQVVGAVQRMVAGISGVGR